MLLRVLAELHRLSAAVPPEDQGLPFSQGELSLFYAVNLREAKTLGCCHLKPHCVASHEAIRHKL